MAWVTWRQHRSQLVIAAGLLLALAAAAFGTRLPIQAAFHRDSLSACLPPAARSGCDIIVPHFEGEFAGWVTAARVLAVLPVLAGLFVGAPLLARELEQGTYRFAWTQGITRRRWLLSKTAFLAAATLLAGAVASAVVMWWRGPFDTLEGRIGPSSFDVESAGPAAIRSRSSEVAFTRSSAGRSTPSPSAFTELKGGSPGRTQIRPVNPICFA